MNIDFSSTEPQHVANLGDVQRFFQVNDPGYQNITQLPVIYNQYSASHLHDQAHAKRLVWLNIHQQGMIKTIIEPDFIEKSSRSRSDGHFSITLISELYSGGKREGRFLTIAISLSKFTQNGYH